MALCIFKIHYDEYCERVSNFARCFWLFFSFCPFFAVFFFNFGYLLASFVQFKTCSAAHYSLRPFLIRYRFVSVRTEHVQILPLAGSSSFRIYSPICFDALCTFASFAKEFMVIASFFVVAVLLLREHMKFVLSSLSPMLWPLLSHMHLIKYRYVFHWCEINIYKIYWKIVYWYSRFIFIGFVCDVKCHWAYRTLN